MKGEISHVLEGEVIGEVSFIDSRPPSATVTAKRDSMVGAVPAPLLRQKLDADDPASRAASTSRWPSPWPTA